MKSVYFVRHGQTVWNVENKICGATDIELTALGHEQAIETGKKILEKKIEADVILYSPLVRAKDTALHISEITGIPAKEEMRLKEQNFGKYESTARDGAKFREAKKQFVERYEGGESMLQLAQRVYNLLDEVKASGKTCILVAHNGIARVVQSYFYEQMKNIRRLVWITVRFCSTNFRVRKMGALRHECRKKSRHGYDAGDYLE